MTWQTNNNTEKQTAPCSEWKDVCGTVSGNPKAASVTVLSSTSVHTVKRKRKRGNPKQISTYRRSHQSVLKKELFCWSVFVAASDLLLFTLMSQERFRRRKEKPLPTNKQHSTRSRSRSRNYLLFFLYPTTTETIHLVNKNGQKLTNDASGNWSSGEKKQKAKQTG